MINSHYYCMMTRCILLLCFVNLQPHLFGQVNYFVDGFHGGVYGHYPLNWYTQYIVDECKKNPKWRIGLEIEPETWDTVETLTPKAYKAFQRLIASPQAEITNPTYAQPYLYNISGESIIRQFQYGIRKLRHHFPGITFHTYSSEEPCFTSQLPQILRQLGFSYLVLKNPNTCWGGYTKAMGGQLLDLEGPDGSSIYTVPRYACEALQPGSVWQTTAWVNSREFLSACEKAGILYPVGMCYQDAGWKNGPWLKKPQRQTQYIRWTDYFRHVADTAIAPRHAFSQEDVCPALMWGSQVLQRIAREVRHSENLIIQAEKVAAMRFIDSGQLPKQTDFDEAWRCLMLAQHHDSWIVPYNNFKIKGSWANAIKYWTGRSDSLSMVQIERTLSCNEQNSHFLTIYNTTGHARHEVVFTVDGNGNEIALEAKAPAYGYATLEYPHTAGGCSQRIKGLSAILENDAYKMVFDLSAGGVVSSFVDKQTGRDLVGKGDTAFHFNELKGYFPLKQRFCTSMEEPAQARLTMNNDLAKRIEISGKVAGVPFVQTVTLKKGSPIVDFKLKILWHRGIRIGEDVAYKDNSRRTCFYDTRYMLNVLFPSSFKPDVIYKDAPLDVCKSRLKNTFFNSWDSIKNNVMLHWVDIRTQKDDYGLTLLSDHTTSYSFGQHHPLALTVQYAGPGLWWRDYPLDGPSEICYALVPHRDNWDKAGIQRLATDWQEPLLVSHGKAAQPAQSYFQSRYRLLSVAQDGSALNFRLFNADGDDAQETVHFNFGVRNAEVVDLNGNILQPLEVNDGDIKIRIPRFGFRTIRVTL